MLSLRRIGLWATVVAPGRFAQNRTHADATLRSAEGLGSLVEALRAVDGSGSDADRVDQLAALERAPSGATPRSATSTTSTTTHPVVRRVQPTARASACGATTP